MFVNIVSWETGENKDTGRAVNIIVHCHKPAHVPILILMLSKRSHQLHLVHYIQTINGQLLQTHPAQLPSEYVIWTESLWTGSKETNSLPKQPEFCHRVRYWDLWGRSWYAWKISDCLLCTLRLGWEFPLCPVLHLLTYLRQNSTSQGRAVSSLEACQVQAGPLLAQDWGSTMEVFCRGQLTLLHSASQRVPLSSRSTDILSGTLWSRKLEAVSLSDTFPVLNGGMITEWEDKMYI